MKKGIHALARLIEQGMLDKLREKVAIGQRYKKVKGKGPRSRKLTILIKIQFIFLFIYRSCKPGNQPIIFITDIHIIAGKPAAGM